MLIHRHPCYRVCRPSALLHAVEVHHVFTCGASYMTLQVSYSYSLLGHMCGSHTLVTAAQ